MNGTLLEVFGTHLYALGMLDTRLAGRLTFEPSTSLYGAVGSGENAASTELRRIAQRGWNCSPGNHSDRRAKPSLFATSLLYGYTIRERCEQQPVGGAAEQGQRREGARAAHWTFRPRTGHATKSVLPPDIRIRTRLACPCARAMAKGFRAPD